MTTSLAWRVTAGMVFVLGALGLTLVYGVGESAPALVQQDRDQEQVATIALHVEGMT